jgi:hypothetical protein
MLERLRRLPFELRIALLALCGGTVLNILWAISQWGAKIDTGLATLTGAIIGFSIVGKQARRGFYYLTRSQANQAELDRLARMHKAELEEGAATKATEKERSTLLAALRSEIVGLLDAAQTAERTASKFAEIADMMARQHLPATTKSITYPTFDAPIYLANLSRIGLLGPSLGGDVVKVLSRTRNKKSEVTSDGPLPHAGIKMLYEASAESFGKWANDLVHVAMRIRSIEEGWPDPGTLIDSLDARRAGTFEYTHAPKFEGIS